MLKKIKSLFIIEEESSVEEKLEQISGDKSNKSQSSKSKKTVKSSADIGKQETVIEEEMYESSVSKAVKPRKKFTDILLKAIDAQDLEGPDYLEFKSSLKSLESVIEEEETRFKSSFAVLQSAGITKDSLLSSGKHYLDVLDNEKKKFEETFREQQRKQVKQKEAKIQQLQTGINKRKEHLQKLITEIECMEKSMETSRNEINKAASKVQLTKDQFMASFGQVKGQIQSDFDKINQYL